MLSAEPGLLGLGLLCLYGRVAGQGLQAVVLLASHDEGVVQRATRPKGVGCLWHLLPVAGQLPAVDDPCNG